jgi:hypothetical protein
MIEEKQIPNEYVSIRNTWLKGIEDCRRSISQMAMVETGSQMKAIDVAGARTIVYTVDALDLSLVNYGEALIEHDVEQWKEQYYYPENDEIWKRKKKRKPGTTKFAGFPDIDDEEEEEDLSINQKWYRSAKLSKKLYRQIIHVLNKYNMLFESTPTGYSNVIMENIYQ